MATEVKKQKKKKVWSKQEYEDTAHDIIAQFGCIPPQVFMDCRGYSSFRSAIEQFGPTILETRRQFDVHNVRLCSVDKQAWLSIAETNTANMLLIRGFEVLKGYIAKQG